MARKATRPRWALLVVLAVCAAFTAPFWHTGTIAATLPSGTLPIRDQLVAAFEKKMCNTKAPLLRDFETYAKSLPVRKVNDGGEVLKLFELPFWARQLDVQAMAEKLEAKTDRSARGAVKYLAAPGQSGKTASILPAFLESNFTHYLYIACTNNGDRNFKVMPSHPSNDEEMARMQGAAFMDECVQILLGGLEQGPFNVELCQSPPAVNASADRLRKTLKRRLGPNAKVLFHIDEHRKMCRRSSDDESGAAFSRGAFECLAAINGATVATYTSAPPLPAKASSEVCRDPVAGICLDLDAAMQAISELSYDPKDLNAGQERVWATVRFRLAVRLEKLGLAWLHRREGNQAMEKFLKEYQRITQESTDVQQILDKLAAHCQVKLNGLDEDPNAAKLLVGMRESMQDDWERQVRNLVLLDDLVTASLEELLSIYDPNVKVYADGADRFGALLSEKDLLAQTPLEVAYAWVLSCKASLKGKLTFLKEGANFRLKCTALRAGRIFPDTDNSDYDVSTVEDGILYYADERKDRKPTHPLADLFFRTDEGELVLVDITGSSETTIVEQKEEKLAAWIQREQPSMEGGMTLKGIVLAPWVDEESTIGSTVCMVCGDDARQLLGGLGQLARWL